MSSATHPPPPAASSRRLTREDILRAGRSASPWEFIPLAHAALRIVPDDAEIRFLLAAAFAKLALRTPASEHLALLPSELRIDTGVRSLADLVAALPNDHRTTDQLTRTLTTNLAALGDRAPAILRAALPEWSARAAQRTWFHASTGDIVWRSRADPASWQRLDPQREPVGALKLPHDDSPTAAEYPMWYALDGIDPPWLLQRVWSSTAHRYDGYAPHILVSQCDPLQALDGLAQLDLARELSDPRVLFFIGPDAPALLRDFFDSHARAGHRVATVAIALPTTTPRLHPSAQTLANTAAAATAALDTAAREAALARAHDRAFCAHRFASAGPHDPLRVLIPASLYTTFIRHSAADLADAFSASGCQTRLLIEPDHHTLLEPLASLRTCADFRPDLIILPNFLRATVAARFPADIPLITWVQDSMPHLFEPNIGSRLTDRDFIAGNLREEMFQSFAYPRDRAMHVPMAASTRKFHPGPVPSDLRRRHACELAYVSHHSETPDALHRRRVAEAQSLPGVPALLNALFPRILALIESATPTTPLTADLRTLALDALRQHGLPTGPSHLAGVLTTYIHPIADRALRHRALAWAADIAAQRNWRFHLYGRAWDTHPTLAPFAKGELDHGDDLRACYQTARAHLHLSLHTAIHQRVFECALSGGLPLSLLTEGDLSQLEFLAALDAARAGAAPLCSHLHRRPASGHHTLGFPPTAAPETRRYTNLLHALDIPAPDFLWLNSIHIERLATNSEPPVAGGDASLRTWFPDPAAIMFHDRATLERALVRAVENDAWRTRTSAALADHARSTITYDVLASRLIALVSNGLGASRPASPSTTPTLAP